MGTPADPIGWAMMGASVVKGATSIIGGMNESNAMKSRAASAEYEAKIADLRGVQVSGQRKDELNQALSAIDTIRAGRGNNLDSATGRAIRSDRRQRSKDAENVDVLGERLVGVSKRGEAAGLRSGAKWAKIKGFAQSVPSFVQAAGGG